MEIGAGAGENTGGGIGGRTGLVAGGDTGGRTGGGVGERTTGAMTGGEGRRGDRREGGVQACRPGDELGGGARASARARALEENSGMGKTHQCGYVIRCSNRYRSGPALRGSVSVLMRVGTRRCARHMGALCPLCACVCVLCIHIYIYIYTYIYRRCAHVPAAREGLPTYPYTSTSSSSFSMISGSCR